MLNYHTSFVMPLSRPIEYNNSAGIWSNRQGLNLMSLYGNNDWNNTSLKTEKKYHTQHIPMAFFLLHFIHS